MTAVRAAYPRLANLGTPIPYFLFRGNHVKVDLPIFIKEGRKKFPDIDIILGPHLGFHPKMIEIVDERIQQVLDTLKFEEKALP